MKMYIDPCVCICRRKQSRSFYSYCTFESSSMTSSFTSAFVSVRGVMTGGGPLRSTPAACPYAFRSTAVRRWNASSKRCGFWRDSLVHLALISRRVRRGNRRVIISKSVPHWEMAWKNRSVSSPVQRCVRRCFPRVALLMN